MKKMLRYAGWRGFVAFVLALVLAATYVPAASAAEELQFRFKYADPESTILTGYVGTLPEVLQIPASVTTIAERAFAGNNTIVRVIATPRTTRVENSAFRSCRSLKDVSFPRIQYIGASAFEYCENLTGASVGDELQRIDEFAFRYCKSLKGIDFPDSLTVIESGAFNQCESLETITIPDSVTQLGPDRVYGSGWFLETGVFARSGLKTVYLGSGLTALTSGLFEGCHLLEEVQMGPNIKTIGASAFSYCSALESIVLPDKVTSIGREAFMAAGLISLIFPDGARVSDEAFWDCKSLQYVYIPANLEFVDNEPSNAGSFYGCTGLKRVLFGGSAFEWDQLGMHVIDNSGAYVVFNAERPEPKAPQIETQPSSRFAEEGSTIDLSLKASAYNVFTGEPEQVLYQWQIEIGDGTWRNISASDWNYAGSQTNRLTVMNFSAEMNGWNYRCIVVNAADRTKTTTSAAVTLQMQAVEPTATPNPSPTVSASVGTYFGVASVTPGSAVSLISIVGVQDLMWLEPTNGGVWFQISADSVVNIPLTTPKGVYEYSVVCSSGILGTLTLNIVEQVISASPWPSGVPQPTSSSPVQLPPGSLDFTFPGKPPEQNPSSPTPVPAPELPAISGYQAGRIGNGAYQVKVSGSSEMFYLLGASSKLERVAVPYVKDNSGKRWYPLNHGGTALFPRLENDKVTCYCIYQSGKEIPVVSAAGDATPVIMDGYQTGTVGGRPYYVKVSGSSMMFYLRNPAGKMERVAVPYVKDSTGKRWYPVNHGGTALFPMLTGGKIFSYATGSGETVLLAA